MSFKAAIFLGLAVTGASVCAEVLFGPHMVSSTPQIAGNGAGGLHVIGEHAFVAGGTNGLVVLNIADPARPVRVASKRMTNQAGTTTATAVEVTGGGIRFLCRRGSLAVLGFSM